MDKKKLESFKKRLEEQQQTLRKAVSRTEEDGRTADQDSAQDIADRAASSYTKEFLFSVSNDDRQLLQMVETALQRIHDFCCKVLVHRQRDSLVAWITFLLDPTSLKPKSETDKQTLKMVSNDFKSHKSFLNKVLASVQKPCK